MLGLAVILLDVAEAKDRRLLKDYQTRCHAPPA